MLKLALQRESVWVEEGPGGALRFAPPPPGTPADASEELTDSTGARFAAVDVGDAVIPDGVQAVGLRALFDAMAPADFERAQRAVPRLHWRRTHRYCGACGARLERHPTECAMHCASCDTLVYPRINPVAIVRVTRGDEILLARRAHGVTSFHSVIAGFVEGGETLEQAVAREVAEEVGIRVRDIRYFSSQPWSFPNNLMLGFTAEYDGGDLHPDGVEIGEAGWFRAGHLPAIPGPISISRKLIDDFVARSVHARAP